MMLPLWTRVTDGSFCPLQGLAHQALRAEDRDRLDPDARVGTDLPPRHLLDQVNDRAGDVTPALEIVPGIDVLGVLAEDDEVHLVGVLVGGGDAFEVANRTDAGVQIEMLTEADVDRPEPRAHAVVLAALVTGARMVLLVGAVEADVRLFADRGCKRALDCDLQMADSFDRLVGELRAVVVQALEAGEQGAPGDLPGTRVGVGDRAVDDLLHDGSDVEADAVSSQVSDDRMVTDDQTAVPDLNKIALGDLNFLELNHRPPPDWFAAGRRALMIRDVAVLVTDFTRRAEGRMLQSESDRTRRPRRHTGSLCRRAVPCCLPP
jgi:hypothetical protein